MKQNLIHSLKSYTSHHKYLQEEQSVCGQNFATITTKFNNGYTKCVTMYSYSSTKEGYSQNFSS